MGYYRGGVDYLVGDIYLEGGEMKFEEWFVIQCGKDPAPGKTPFELWREVKACRNELGRLELLANDKAN
jgi:hypothetical protein